MQGGWQSLSSWISDCVTLQLALDSARFEFTLKMRLNKIMTERPNICYIFEKLIVQGCQI